MPHLYTRPQHMQLISLIGQQTAIQDGSGLLRLDPYGPRNSSKDLSFSPVGAWVLPGCSVMSESLCKGRVMWLWKLCARAELALT